MNTELIKRRLKKFLDKTSVSDLVKIIESHGGVVGDIESCTGEGIERPMQLLHTRIFVMSNSVPYSNMAGQEEDNCTLAEAA